MPARIRIALLALLIAGAVVAVRAPSAELAPPGSGPRPRAGDPDEAVAWIMLAAAPALALLVFAALRYRRTRPAPQARLRTSPPNWRAALFALVALMSIAVLLGLLGRIGQPTIRKPRRGQGTGSPGDEPSPGRPAVPPQAPEGDGLNIELWSAVVAGMLLLLLLASVLNRRGPAAAPPAPESPHPATPPPESPLATAAEQALAAVDQPGGDPRAAIIRCYTAMERALSDAPAAAPQPADTPSDVVRRAAESGRLQADDGTRLVDLFAEARYSGHPMSEDDRDAAASSLRAILAELRRPAWTRS